jgi:hypothetical protein
MNDPQRFTVIYRIGNPEQFQWRRALWCDSLPFAKSTVDTFARLGYEAHAVDWLSPLPKTFSYVPAGQPAN